MNEECKKKETESFYLRLDQERLAHEVLRQEGRKGGRRSRRGGKLPCRWRLSTAVSMSSILPVPSPSPLLPAVFCHIVAFCRPFVAHILTTTPARSVTVTKPFSPHTVTLQKAVTFSPQSSTSEIDDTKSCKELVLPHKKLEFVKCGTCKEDLGKASFSKAQLRKKKNAKCRL